jgi:hypothetical protein
MTYTDPSADMRQLASTLWQMFVALNREGFTEQQALIIIGHAIATSAMGNGNK